MVIEAGQFLFKRLLDQSCSSPSSDHKSGKAYSPSILPGLTEDQALLRDISNMKVKNIDRIIEKRMREDNSTFTTVSLPKEDLHRIRVELGRQIQRDAGRSRMENLQYFQKLERKEQRDMRLEAKTILLSMKKESRLGTEKYESKCDRPLLKKKSAITPESSLIVLSPLKMSSTFNMFERYSLSKNKLNVPFSKLQNFDCVVERIQNKKASLQRGDQDLHRPLQQRRHSANFSNNSTYFQITNSVKIPLKRKSCGSTQFQITRYNQCEKLEKYRSFLNKVNFANGLLVELTLNESTGKKLVYHIGRGNNSELIRSLMKRRWWWTEGTLENSNFVWTQLKKQDVFNRQTQYQDNQKSETMTSSYLNASFCSDSSRSNSDVKHLKQRQSDVVIVEDKILTNSEMQEYSKMQSSKILRKVEPKLVHNHMPGNCHLGNKKALFFNLRQYCQLSTKELFDLVPLTYHVGDDYKAFQKQYKRRGQLIKQGNNRISNLWIVKPGENSNRGNGIQVIDSIRELDDLLAQCKHHSNGEKLTYIVQQYMNRPFLYNRRKFDIRHYMLVTSFGGSVRAYWYKEGYIRTSSHLFDLENTKNTQIHLTNDAIQKHSETYGKYQEANKLSYSEFQRYLQIHFKQRKYTFTDVLAKMRDIAKEAVHATYSKLDPSNKQFNFQIFGLDFMLDENLKPWLIEVNTNPCLQLSSNLLGRIIPNMVEHALRMSLDPLFPPPHDYPVNQRHYLACKVEEYLKFEIIFSSEVDGPALEDLYRNQQQQPQLINIEQDDEEYYDEGKEINFVD